MRQKVARVLVEIEVLELEQRLAPVKCDKNPEAPECVIVDLYGVPPECSGGACRYGVGF
ncbi:MAG: hypothetical protein JXR83_16075 [Deltaproteobacteria bacterium]|nr:hypothetical protein [Deltaproteobacteria bacterium]